MIKLKTLTAAVLIGAGLLVGAAPALAATTHTVRRGDSLWAISRSYGTTVAALRQHNGIQGHLIYPGQKLIIPGKATRSYSLNTQELDLLARVVSAEARGEPYEGQVAVAAVILNRTRSGSFPDTVTGVVYQGTQFESVLLRTHTAKPAASSVKAAKAAAGGKDPTGGALYFFNPAKTKNKFLWGRPHAITIAQHRFTY